ncbi:MAG: hypothetical protein KDB79_00170 [Acidobacteria bacterium]|nr:hypothetical protein [Acidobacteriota bacterium]
MKKILSISFALSLFVISSFAQNKQPFEWLPGGTYDPNVPTPEQFLGYEIGDYLTDNLQMAAYIQKLQETSKRVKVFQYGESVERRKLWLVAISSPENIQNLETIRTSIKRLTDPRQTSQSEARTIARNTIPIGWMNYGTDGGETSAFETGIQLLYQMTAGTDPLTQKILNNSITIINPALNPDSHQAFVAWAKNSTIRGGTPDPIAYEHFVDWFASSDGNHFKIDLNRDAFALTQPETQAASKVLQHWNPQVWIDNHGEPDEYYMAPFTSPVNNNYPASLKKWAETVGQNSAKYFDRYGWTYVKDENYDLYFPGYWDSYPAFNGAIAATYESNGGGSKGFKWERPDGTIVTLREAVHKHFTADIATLEVLADNREAILNDFYGFFKTGMDEVDTEQFKTFVIDGASDPGKTNDLIELLLRHGIEVYQSSASSSSNRAQSYFDRQSKQRTFPAGSYYIPMRQPKKRFLKTMFEPDPKMEASFMKYVEERRARDAKLGTDSPKEGPGFYDITAWALPLQYGIDTYFTEDERPVSGMTKITSRPAQNSGSLGRGTYGYAFSNSQNSGTKLAGKLLQKDINVAITLLPTSIGGRKFDKGTYLVRNNRNPEDLHAVISKYAKEYETDVVPINTARGEGGISLGSEYVINLERPKIMVMTKEPTGAVTFGSVYSVLSQRFDLDFVAVSTEMFNRANLSRYNVIIFPDGSPGAYEDILGKNGVARLRAWIENGGTFIGLKGGAAFTTREGVEFTDVKLVRSQKAESENTDTKPIESIPGSIFKAIVNNDHYLALGYPTEIAVQFRGNYHFTPTKKGANVVVYKPDGYIMGHIWDTTMENLGGKLFMADVPLGDGHVILFADDPTFRAYWRGLDRLFIGSILMSNSF